MLHFHYLRFLKTARIDCKKLIDITIVFEIIENEGFYRFVPFLAG